MVEICGRSYTRHSNWNVKVRQHPMPYPFNSVVRQLSQSWCYSSIGLQNRISSLSPAGNNDLNPHKKNSPKFWPCTFSLIHIPYGLMGFTTLVYNGSRPSHLVVQQRRIHILLTIKEWHIVYCFFAVAGRLVKHQKAALLALERFWLAWSCRNKPLLLTWWPKSKGFSWR